MKTITYAIAMAESPPKDIGDAFLEEHNAQVFGRNSEEELDQKDRYSLHAMPLTRAGNEIAAILNWDPSKEALQRFEEALRQQGENLKPAKMNL
jgi:hypothetical protein